MNATIDAVVGDTWAYRARRADPLIQAEVVRLGTKTPKRVLIRFVDDEYEGRQEWVPPARLKAFWREVGDFIARERRWDAVAAATPGDDEAVVSAASIVFDLIVKPELATIGFNATDGVIHIHDVDGLAALLALDPKVFRSDPLSFEEQGALVASWAITEVAARRAAGRNWNAVLLYVEREEADARREALFGRYYPRRGRGQDLHISSEICAQVDEESGQPVRAILRGWCGQEPVDLRREIAELRKEATRLGVLAQAALDALSQAGYAREVRRLEQDLGSVREGGPKS